MVAAVALVAERKLATEWTLEDDDDVHKDNYGHQNVVVSASCEEVVRIAVEEVVVRIDVMVAVSSDVKVVDKNQILEVADVVV